METLDPQEVIDLHERIRARDVTIECLAQIIDGRNYEIRSARAEVMELRTRIVDLSKRIADLHRELGVRPLNGGVVEHAGIRS